MKKLIPLTLLCVLTLGYSAQAQECGTVATPAQIQQMHVTRIQRANYTAWRGQKMMPTLIPVQAHIVRTSAGTGGLSNLELTNLISSMNAYYTNANIEFFQCSGPNYINSDTYYNFDANDETTLGNTYDVTNVINIYFFNTVTSTGGDPLCGYTRFPPSADRIIMDRSCAINGSTMSHEMGHYFSLYHTHGTSNNGTTDELVNGSNCSTAGDELCDTPADPNLDGVVNGSCQYIGTATDLNGQSYNPDPTNIMSYSLKSCRTNLTTQQYNRIAYSMANERNYLTCTTGAQCTSGANNTGDTYINNVVFNTISNATTACADYSNHTSITTSVQLGTTYTLSVTTGDCDGGSSYQRQTKAYIDWNGDYDFYDAGEEVLAEAFGNPTTTTVSVTVPLTATTGMVKFRVVTTESSSVIDACGNYEYGETEDYMIEILEDPCQLEISTFPYNQNFESFALCTDVAGTICDLTAGWTNDSDGDDMDWICNWGATVSSNTGPTQDYNPGSASGKYLYLESTDPGNPSKMAIASTPCFNLSSLSDPELRFAYHMYGAFMGTLYVDVSTNEGATWNSIWSKTGDQGNIWSTANIDLSAYNTPIKLRFRGITGAGYTSDMAIDDVTIGESCALPNAMFGFSSAGNYVIDFTGPVGSDSYYWDFGDGGTSTDQNPSYDFWWEDLFSVCLTTSNSCGSNTYCNDLYVSSGNVTGIKSTTIESNPMSFYPNPTNGLLYLTANPSVSTSSSMNYKIVDVLGKVVMEENGFRLSTSGSVLDLTGLNKGLYFIQYSINGKIAMEKILLE